MESFIIYQVINFWYLSYSDLTENYTVVVKRLGLRLDSLDLNPSSTMHELCEVGPQIFICKMKSIILTLSQCCVKG